MITTPEFPRGLVVRIRRSHRRGPGSIPGVGTLIFICIFHFVKKVKKQMIIKTKSVTLIH